MLVWRLTVTAEHGSSANYLSISPRARSPVGPLHTLPPNQQETADLVRPSAVPGSAGRAAFLPPSVTPLKLSCLFPRCVFDFRLLFCE